MFWFEKRPESHDRWIFTPLKTCEKRLICAHGASKEDANAVFFPLRSLKRTIQNKACSAFLGAVL
jgi:hypothetical protein